MNAHDAAMAIIDDLRQRRGLRQAWEEIDEDMQDDIAEKWVDLIAEAYGEPK